MGVCVYGCVCMYVCCVCNGFVSVHVDMYVGMCVCVYMGVCIYGCVLCGCTYIFTVCIRSFCRRTRIIGINSHLKC